MISSVLAAKVFLLAPLDTRAHRASHKVLLLCLLPAMLFAQAPPDADAQAAIVGRMRDYAESYTQRLPNFVCTQVTTRYQAGRKPDHWSKGDRVVAQLTYSDGEEHQSIQMINKKPVTGHVNPNRWRFTTAGEFGHTLHDLFDPESRASFEWRRFETIRGHLLNVFDYSIEQSHSSMRLTSFGVSATVAYQGTIWADADTGQIWRYENHALSIPTELDILEIGTTTEYDTVQIASASYMLPVRSETTVRNSKSSDRNAIEFLDYRKFTANATITFGEADPAAPPKN